MRVPVSSFCNLEKCAQVWEVILKTVTIFRQSGKNALEFFLNGTELSLNSVSSKNLINHWSMNWAQFKDPVSRICRANILVSYTRGGRFEVSTWKTFRKNSDNYTRHHKGQWHHNLWYIAEDTNTAHLAWRIIAAWFRCSLAIHFLWELLLPFFQSPLPNFLISKWTQSCHTNFKCAQSYDTQISDIKVTTSNQSLVTCQFRGWTDFYNNQCGLHKQFSWDLSIAILQLCIKPYGFHWNFIFYCLTCYIIVLYFYSLTIREESWVSKD